jgi:hypothetical protein
MRAGASLARKGANVGYGFGAAMAAAGAADALRQVRLDRAEQAERDMRMKVLMQQLGAAEDTRSRSARDQQLQEAAIALQQADLMGQGSELSPDVSKLLSGTPYGARVQQHQTLPSRSVAGLGPTDFSDPGGRAYSTLHPTQAQMREQQQRTDLEAFTNDSTLPPMMRRWVGARRAGLPVPNPESLETSTERASRLEVDRTAEFGDFTRRADYTARVNAQARRQAQIEAANAPITPRDRLTAIREADEAAARILNSMQDNLGMLPEGIDPNDLREQIRDEYLATLESSSRRPSSRTYRVIDELRPIVAQPTRTGRMTADYLMPRTPATPRTPPAGTGDPYEQYLARTAR